jgi:hypothetical protein
MRTKSAALRAARDHAEHIALRVATRGGVFTLSERNSAKKKLGTDRSAVALRRTIWKYHNAELARLGAEDKRRRLR